MDEEDERRAAEIARKSERLAARQKLIDAEARRQEATKTEHQDFLDKQLAEEHEKEKKEITEMNERRTRLLNERRQDFLESRALIEARSKVKTEREQNTRVFPWDGDEEGNEAYRQRQAALSKAAQDQAQFQRTQAREKREKEAVEREREKLEFKHRVEAFLRRAQDYACELLQKAKDNDDSDLQYYTQ
jgi:hypothetical protein